MGVPQRKSLLDEVGKKILKKKGKNKQEKEVMKLTTSIPKLAWQA